MSQQRRRLVLHCSELLSSIRAELLSDPAAFQRHQVFHGRLQQVKKMLAALIERMQILQTKEE